MHDLYKVWLAVHILFTVFLVWITCKSINYSLISTYCTTLTSPFTIMVKSSAWWLNFNSWSQIAQTDIHWIVVIVTVNSLSFEDQSLLMKTEFLWMNINDCASVTGQHHFGDFCYLNHGLYYILNEVLTVS